MSAQSTPILIALICLPTLKFKTGFQYYFTIFMVQMKKADSSIKKSLVLLFRMECFFVSLSVAVAIKLILYVNQENQFHFLKL